jgi:predicted anti-sigma-YlaC factor YlaD
MHGHCERARQWASADVDGELSTFERALLADHVERCASCRDFSRDVAGLTGALRAAPREPYEGVVISRVRRHVRLRLAPAAAAMAILAVGLGSLLASTQLTSGGSLRQAEPVTPLRSNADFALNQGRSRQLKQVGLAELLPPSRPGPALTP